MKETDTNCAREGIKTRLIMTKRASVDKYRD